MSKQKDKEVIKDEVITLAMKEEEIKQAYRNIPNKEKQVSKKIKTSKNLQIKNNEKLRIIKVLFLVLMILLILISIDIIRVLRFDKGPFFAVPLKEYKDESKAYYGLGYKVIKYNEKIGGKYYYLGFWNLKYQKPINIKDSALLEELIKAEQSTYNKYKKKLVEIDSTLYEINPESQKITAKYDNKEKNTKLFIICPITEREKQKAFNKLISGKAIKMTGNLTKVKTKIKDEKQKINIYMINCSIEQ